MVVHDRLVPQAILELARREAEILEVGKTAFGPSWKQDDINALIVRHALKGRTVVRLKGGDPAVFGRLDEEIEALEAAGVTYGIVPGVTSASAGAAAIGQSLTRRGRNSAFRFLTGHDVDGFAEHEWRELAKPGSTAAIYMGTKAATFLRGRLMMHGAPGDTPVTAVENASRPEQRVIATTLIELPLALRRGGAGGAGDDPLRSRAARGGGGARRIEGGALMARKFQPQMATGNDLLEGDVVYFTSTGEWSRSIGDAALAVNAEAADDAACPRLGVPEPGRRRLPGRGGDRRLRPGGAGAFPRGVPHPRALRTIPSMAGRRSVPMYDYTEFDRDFVRTRVAEFRDQVERRIAGSLTEAEFLPLRLRNGLYLQLHAYMLRVAIPYGTLNSRKLRQLAMIAERWDKGYGHFTTRQNIQFNWPKLRDVPDILDALADVEMHAIQTSGNCIRNVTADHFAGAAADEIEDPRPTAELLRQWSTDHPEFLYLPRKFKIGITGAPNDRAVTKSHDIGLRMVPRRAAARRATRSRSAVASDGRR